MRVALIVARDFAELQEICAVVEAAPEGVKFVIRAGEAVRDPAAPPPEPGKLHKTVPLLNILRDLSITPEVMELDPALKWSHKMSSGEEISGDRRSEVRDERIKVECDRVLVFRTPQTKTLENYRGKDWLFEKLWPHVRTIERGEQAKKKHRKGRPVS